MVPEFIGRVAAPFRVAQLGTTACLALASLVATAQPAPGELGCAQIAAELQALSATPPAAAAQAGLATAAGTQPLGALVQQAGARGGQGGSLGGMFSGSMGGPAPAGMEAATLQALAQQRAAGTVGNGQAAQAAGVVGLLGGLMPAAQAAQPVATPGNAAIAHLAGSRQEQLGGLFLAKGCR